MVLLMTSLLLVTVTVAGNTTTPQKYFCPSSGTYLEARFCAYNSTGAGDVAVSYDTIFTATDGRTLAFQESHYQELTSSGASYPRPISELYPGLSNDIDAAFTLQWPGNDKPQTYFIKKKKMWRYTGNNLDVGYPKSIAPVFSGVPRAIDAAVAMKPGYVNAFPQIYFFKGNNYWVYSHGLSTPVSGPMNIAQQLNPGIPNDVEAAFRFTDGYIYFVKNNQYYQWDETYNKISTPMSGLHFLAMPSGLQRPPPMHPIRP